MDNNPTMPVCQNQLPDENDIERLFPRCPPNENPQTNQRIKSRRDQANNFQSAPGRQTNNSKVQQQSRRQTKARRNRSAKNSKKQPEKLSDSSDENNNNSHAPQTATKNVNYHANCAHPSPSTVGSQPITSTRKLKTYRASQSLSQQLKKSHSSYNTTTNNTNGESPQLGQNVKTNTSKITKNVTSLEDHSQNVPATSQDIPVRGPTGIVKSHSTYANFLNESINQTPQMPTITEAQVETELECAIEIPAQVPTLLPTPTQPPTPILISTATPVPVVLGIGSNSFDPIPLRANSPEVELEKELDASMEELVEKEPEPSVEDPTDLREPDITIKESDEKVSIISSQDIEKELSIDIDRIALNSVSQFNSSANANTNSIIDSQHLTKIPFNDNSNKQVDHRSSSLQFNTLSDNESETDQPPLSNHEHQVDNSIITRSFNADMTNKCDMKLSGRTTVDTTNLVASKSDEDLTPTAKTALVFPRLDEGLSSEAESNEEEVDEDDEKGMEADVEADDDDDDDEDDDEDEDIDEEADTQSIHISSRTRLDSYINKQMKSLTMGNIHHQQQQQNIVPSSLVDQNNLTHHHQTNKSTNSNYANYVGGNEQLDIKSMNNNNYSNQNGQSNYWMNNSNNQTNIAPSQSTSSQQYNNQIRNHHSSNNNNSSSSLASKNNSYNRGEEAKATSRLSSDTDNETDRLLGSQRSEQLKMNNNTNNNETNSNSEVQPISNVMKPTNANSREVLIEGVLFGVKYLGSTHSDCEGRAEKEDRIQQAEMAVHEVKFRNGDSQIGTEVQLFISTEKIMVLDDKQRRIMMDHSLRTISYIADIGDAIVLIVRKKNSSNDMGELGRPISKISCHVFESNESHTITKSISQAFQVAYTELLKANGASDVGNYLPKEMDYQEVLNSQEMSTDHLEMFARKENQREVVVPKKKGEILGLSIIESGWGSVLPTVVIANLKQDGPAYNCKKLSIGDQILSVNGVSLVGLPLSECQEILKKTKEQRVAKLSVVPCPVTVEVKIKRPDTKYQLGFSVQNGVICSLLRGGIAERGGVRVGHRIMSINGTTVVGVPHEKIVTLLASSVGEIRMETCLTSLYRLMLGEENPVHF